MPPSCYVSFKPTDDYLSCSKPKHVKPNLFGGEKLRASKLALGRDLEYLRRFEQSMPYHVMSRHFTSRHIASSPPHLISSHPVSSHGMAWNGRSRHVTSCRIASRHFMPYHAPYFTYPIVYHKPSAVCPMMHAVYHIPYTIFHIPRTICHIPCTIFRGERHFETFHVTRLIPPSPLGILTQRASQMFG